MRLRVIKLLIGLPILALVVLAAVTAPAAIHRSFVAVFKSSPANPVVGQAVTFDSTGSSCGNSTPCTYSWVDDGPDGPGGTDWPLGTGAKATYTFHSAGTKYVRLKVYNRYGTLRAQVEHDVVVASSTTPSSPPPGTTSPDTTITAHPSDPTTATTASFSFTSSESGGTFTCALDGASSSCSSPKSYSGLSVGQHTFTVAATDAARSTDPTPASFTWQVQASSQPPSPPPSSGGDGLQFPNESTTGTPAGWTPSTIRSTDMTVTTPGAVVQDIRFTNGAKLDIKANNVTVQRVEFQGGWLETDGYSGVLIQDSTFDRLAAETNGGEGVISYCGYTARRVKILDRNEGFRESGCDAGVATTIEDSFARITPPANCTDWHGDGIQGYYGTDLHVTNVTIDFHETSSCGGTAPFFYNGGPGGSPNGHAFVKNLLVKGGGFSFRLGTPAPNSVEGLKIVDNAWQYGPIDVYASDGGGCAAISPWDAQLVQVDSNWKVTQVDRTLPCTNSSS